MKKVTDKMIALCFGSPCPSWEMYRPDMIKCLVEYTEEEVKEEFKKADKKMKKAWKCYNIQRKKELEELEKLLKENGDVY